MIVQLDVMLNMSWAHSKNNPPMDILSDAHDGMARRTYSVDFVAHMATM